MAWRPERLKGFVGVAPLMAWRPKRLTTRIQLLIIQELSTRPSILANLLCVFLSQKNRKKIRKEQKNTLFYVWRERPVGVI